MPTISDEILKIITTSNGLKATDIASKLNLTRTEVNSCLYGQLRGKVQQDAKYKWYIANAIVTNNNLPLVQPDIALQNICKYYLHCLSISDGKEIEAWARGQFSLNYRELASVDFDNLDYKDGTSILASTVSGNPSMQPTFGFPTLLKKFKSRDGNWYYKVVPVLIFQAELQNGVFKKVDAIPRINPQVIKFFSENDSDATIYEIMDLENELGLNNLESDVEFDDIVSRLVSIRPAWNWIDEINTEQINSNFSISQLENTGIYNKAILILSERSPYTQGLEYELKALSNMPESSYCNTALHNWIYPTNTENKQNNDLEVIEVLPLNSEQEQAVKMALSANHSIITGPPGTGKSQVVTDIILNSAWNGKSVLFASKNNKAVDVVESRVNGLGNRPILLRLGGMPNANNLPNMVQELLASTTTFQDRQEYDILHKEYLFKIVQINSLKEKKNKIIELRNQVDAIEMQLEEYRRDAGNLWKTITADHITEYYTLITELETAFGRTQRQNQPLLIRGFWAFLQGKRENIYCDCAKRTNIFLANLNATLLPLDSKNITQQSINTLLTSVRRILSAIGKMIEYKNLLNKLNDCESPAEIDKSTYKIKTDIAKTVQNLWQKWLITQTKVVSAPDRIAITNLLAQIRLNDNNNYRAINQLSASLSKYLPCWAVTSLSAKGKIPFNAGMFDLLVIDEASQCDIASVLPLLFRAKGVVIIGDPKQLNHICGLSKIQDKNLLEKYSVSAEWSYKEMSLFDFACGRVNPNNMVQLRDHHRSHADIINFSNEEFYNGSLRVATKYNRLKLPANDKPGIRWINVAGTTERPFNGGSINKIEADKLIEELSHLVLDNSYRGTVGICTPFRAQVEYIREKIAQNTELQQQLQSQNEFLVETVHKFQGDERDVMLFSPVISNGISDGSLGFLSNTGNLFNVAITRARSILIVVGNHTYCNQCGVSYLENFTKYTAKLEQRIIENSSKIVFPTNREYPFVDNIEQVSDWERYFFTLLFDASIRSIPQFKVEKYRLDFAVIDGERRLDIEIDGETYHKDWTGELCYRDQLRNHRLFELGWDVHRFWVYQVRDTPDWCVEQVKNWLYKGTV